MRKLSQIEEELQQVRRNLDRAGKLDAMLKDLREQHLHRRKAAEAAFAALSREEDLAAEGQDSLAARLTRRGGTSKKPAPRRELAEATARYEEAQWDLEDLEDRLWSVKEERAGLQEQEERYQELLREKEQFLCCTGSSQVPRLVQIAREGGQADRQLREIREAIQAGEQVQAQLKELSAALEQAKNLDWDMPGGYTELQQVQACAREARGALSRLQTELADLSPRDLPGVDLEGFSAFADYFLDGLFADLFERGGLDGARTGVGSTRCEVDTLMQGLKQALEETQGVRAALNRERETLLAKT